MSHSEGASDEVDQIILRRFLPYYVPWFGFEVMKVRELLSYPPYPEYVEELRRPEDPSWHAGRVRHFYDELLAGRSLTPVMIDCECGVTDPEGRPAYIYPEPLLVDGHHRLAAYRLAKRATFPAYYSGRVDVLKYLIGQRRTMPRE